MPVEPILRAAPLDEGVAHLDLADAVGNPDAVEAMVVAAAGAHHLLMLGPPGAGKTMLAARLPGLAARPRSEAALEASSIRARSPGLTGQVRPHDAAPVRGPAPHRERCGDHRRRHGVIGRALRRARHTACCSWTKRPSSARTPSTPSGSRSSPGDHHPPLQRGGDLPGEVPAAHGRELRVRAGSTVRRMRCASAPRCRAAAISDGSPDRCSTASTSSFRCERITAAQLRMGASGTTTAEARERVAAARARSAERLVGTPWRVSAQLPGTWLRSAA